MPSSTSSSRSGAYASAAAAAAAAAWFFEKASGLAPPTTRPASLPGEAAAAGDGEFGRRSKSAIAKKDQQK